MASSLPRGIRNNNPLNLRRSKTPWLGKFDYPTDKDFEQFISMRYGIRAGLINIRTILKRNKDCTLLHLIEIWAPASDGNNVRAYANRVASFAGIYPFYVLDFSNRIQICRVVLGMIIVECGYRMKLESILDVYDWIKGH